MTKDLDKAKEIFLKDDTLDDEELADNEARIAEWEKELIENQAFASWQAHDITRMLVSKLKESYKEFGVRLSIDRRISDEHRKSLWAKQDACAFILELADKDARGTLERVEKEIKAAINAT